LIYYTAKGDDCHMLLRPADASGDILPVRSSSAMLSGPEAVALLVRYRLSLLRGGMVGESGMGILRIRSFAGLPPDGGGDCSRLRADLGVYP
jgi:hypothetical protein